MDLVLKHQCKPEQDGKKRKGCPTTVDEPEIKMGKTESAGGDETNNATELLS